MNTPASSRPDPASIFDFFRGNHATELLTAAVSHFDLFSRLAGQPLDGPSLEKTLGISRRARLVLTTALRAMGLLELDAQSRYVPSAQGRTFLARKSEMQICDYIGLASQSPGVLEMVERLKTGRPAGAEDQGAAFIYRDGLSSAMEEAADARRLTASLAGRARNVAPVMAEKLDPGNAHVLLDVGTGSGLYGLAMLQKHPGLRAILFDRPHVLDVARENAAAMGLADRVTFQPGDMFTDPLPPCDLLLLSNILHDWDEDTCDPLVQRCAAALNPGGRLVIHDVLLNDALDGPLPVALYSAALFSLTEGRAYSAAEFTGMLKRAGLAVLSPPQPTLVHAALLAGRKI